MSNYCFDINLKTSVCIPLDQVCDGEGEELLLDPPYSKNEVKSFLMNEIIFAIHNAISDGRYDVEVDEKELSFATNLFFTNDSE